MTDLEKELYPAVEKFVRKEFGCFATAINVGLRLGRIDVVGLRDIGGDLAGRDEMVAIEVKRGTQPFATCAGQTLGYSIFAEQCYLADYRPTHDFNSDEKAIANRLGIGLIRIKSKTTMNVVLSAPTREPIDRLRTQLCERLGYSRCTVCQTLFQRGSTPTGYQYVTRQEHHTGAALRKAVAAEKGIMYWLYDSATMSGKSNAGGVTTRRRYVCPDCVASLFAHLKSDD